MLSLESTRWLDLEAAGGNPLLVPRLIQALARNSNTWDWDEVWEQVSHQWSGYTIAFAAVPHLVHLAIEQGQAMAPQFLLGLGRTVDSVACLGPPPADLATAYGHALQKAAFFAEQAARTIGYSFEDYICVLHGAAALLDRTGLGKQLFFNLLVSGPELDCAQCGAYLSGEFEEAELVFQSVNSRMQPLSDKAWVRPRQFDLGPLQGLRCADDFDWLVALCTAAKQEQVLHKISLLYGTLACPLCAAEMVVMSEMERGRA
jgi:hypothetical protein